MIKTNANYMQYLTHPAEPISGGGHSLLTKLTVSVSSVRRLRKQAGLHAHRQDLNLGSDNAMKTGEKVAIFRECLS